MWFLFSARYFRCEFFFFIAIAWSLQCHAEGSDAESVQPTFLIEKDVPIEMLFNNYHMVVDLGELPLRTSGIVKLNLTNRHQVHFRINELELGCRCTSAELSINEIKPESSSLLTVKLSTRRNSKKQVVANTVALVSKVDKSKNITIVLRYRLSGLMGFTGTSYAQEVIPSLDRQTVMIPFLITDPIKPAEIQFDVVPETHGVVVSLVEEDGSRFAKIVFDPAFVPDESMAITITARNDLRELTDTLPLLLCRRKHLEITPRTLRFRATNGELRAACLLRYRPPHKQDVNVLLNSANAGEDTGDAIDAISVEASVESVSLKVRTQRIGRGIYRVWVNGPENKLRKLLGQENRGMLQWHILTSKKSYSSESPISIDSFVSIPSQEKKEVEP